MNEKMKMLWMKYREPIIYILVGGGTTAVAWGCKYLWNLLFFGGTAFPTLVQITVLSVVENIAAIAYAYPANRKWVFHSTNPHILEELTKFTGSRAAVWVLGWLLNMLFVSLLGINVFLSTLIVGIIGVNVNSILSKLLIFRQKSRDVRIGLQAESVAITECTYEDTGMASAA